MIKVFVGNLDFSVTRQNLEWFFAPHGEIVDLVLPLDRDTGQPRGFAFVTFGDEASATEAIRQLDGAELLGRSLRVSAATPKPAGRPGGGGFRPAAGGEDSRPRGGFGRPKGSRRGLRGRKRSL
jgi:RNA recognition motif-containing protein